MSSWDNDATATKPYVKVEDFKKDFHLSFDEAKKRAEGYLTWIGAICNDGLWDFDGDLNVLPHTFLVYDGKLTVNFGNITGNFICCDMGLNDTYGLPISCLKLLLEQNELTYIYYLPKAIDYRLKDNHIKHIADVVFNKDAINIDISKNWLERLPDMSDLNLEYFNCSENTLENLNGFPNVSYIFNASLNQLSYISDTDMDFEVESFNVSSNVLTTIINLPKTSNLNLKNNLQLKSLEGLKKPSVGMKSLNISDTNILSIKEIRFLIFQAEMNNTSIYDFSCGNKLGCVYALNSDLTTFEKSDLEIMNLVISDETKFSTFYSIYNKINNISCSRVNTNSKLKVEIDFFNKIKQENLPISEQEYYEKFLNQVVNEKAIKNNPDTIISSFRWPESFHERIYNLAKSEETVTKFSL